MNKQIRELFKQAGTDSSGKWMSEFNAEKFAELIVQRCIQEIRGLEILEDEKYQQWNHALTHSVIQIEDCFLKPEE